ncbi:hypothetical protein H5410_059076 [Solanum commersonii]|uniref:Uncharacterized protein n=1 Tax=Solanum commersonii TaxID=4109 RepID=A0A9J5W2C6_SOLCO|nr:hypothetical protein H5410_059076 [Solanum commersonii]
MSYFNPFFDDKTLVTILKVVSLNRDIQEIILMDPHWVTKGRSRGNNSQGRGRSSPGSSSGSSSNTPIL